MPRNTFTSLFSLFHRWNTELAPTPLPKVGLLYGRGHSYRYGRNLIMDLLPIFLAVVVFIVSLGTYGVTEPLGGYDNTIPICAMIVSGAHLLFRPL